MVFICRIEAGTWSPDKRKNYNLLDAVSRHTIQVFPKSWAAILLTFDNAGMWNLRSEVWEKRYLGQQLYISTSSDARSLRDEYMLPDDALLCGIVKGLPKPFSHVREDVAKTGLLQGLFLISVFLCFRLISSSRKYILYASTIME